MHIPDALIHSSGNFIPNHSVSKIVNEGKQRVQTANGPTPLVGVVAHD